MMVLGLSTVLFERRALGVRCQAGKDRITCKLQLSRTDLNMYDCRLL